MTAVSNALPEGFSFRSFPNPATDATLLEFNLPVAQQVSIIVHDMLGKKVALVRDQWFGAGTHTLSHDLKQYQAGFYICELQGKNYTKTIKVLKQ